MPSITQKPIGNCGFTNQNTKKWFIVHFTGGTPNLQSLYNYWIQQCGIGSNSHYGIERTDNQWAKAGDIWQFLPHKDGACANCCWNQGAPWFNGIGNINVQTISVECINPSTENAGNMPQVQFDSLAWLIATVCQQEGIPTTIKANWSNHRGQWVTWGDSRGGVCMHKDIDGVNRERCPGMDVYYNQMQPLMDEVNRIISGGTPQGGNYMQQWGEARPEMEKRMWEQVIVMRNNRLPSDMQMPIPRQGTGIYNQFTALLNQGVYIGGVTSEEFDFKGQKVQNFASGQIAYNPGTGKYSIIRQG